LVPGIEIQDAAQVGHDLPRIIHHGSSLQQSFVVGGIDFQDRGKEAARTGPLPSAGSLQAALHECCDLFTRGHVFAASSRQ
jgi:hypothetical protein